MTRRSAPILAALLALAGLVPPAAAQKACDPNTPRYTQPGCVDGSSSTSPARPQPPASAPPPTPAPAPQPAATPATTGKACDPSRPRYLQPGCVDGSSSQASPARPQPPVSAPPAQPSAPAAKLAECTAAAAKDVLHAVFAPELKSYPVLAQVFADANSQAVKAAITDCRAGREGGGLDGMRKWVGRAEVKTHYWDQFGLAHMARVAAEQESAAKKPAEATAASRSAGCTAAAVKDVLRTAFMSEVGNYPDVFDGVFADANSRVVKAAISDCIKGGGVNGLRIWLSKTEGKKSYWEKHGLADMAKQAGCTAAAVGDVLRTVFASELVSYPVLAQVFANDKSQAVEAAIKDCIAGKEGGGAKGLGIWLSKTDVKNRNWNGYGLAEMARQANELARQQRAECTASAANDVLRAVFASELKSYPVFAQEFANDKSRVVDGAIKDCITGKEGGGVKGLRIWLSRTDVKQMYWNSYGLPEMARQADVAREQAAKLAREQAARMTAEAAEKAKAEKEGKEAAAFCRENTSVIYAYDGTEVDASAKSAIWQVWNRFKGIGGCSFDRYYAHGPSTYGWRESESTTGGGKITNRDFESNFRFLWDEACPKAHLYKKVFVIGFSRGAMNAIRFANDYPRCSKGVPVTFIGIVDPVDTLMTNDNFSGHKELLKDKAMNSLKLTKKDLSDYFFTTHATPGFEKTIPIDIPKHSSEKNARPFGPGGGHWVMNTSSCDSGRWSEEQLITGMKALKALGVAFDEAGKPGPEPCKGLRPAPPSKGKHPESEPNRGRSR